MNKIAINNGIFLGVILMVSSMALYFVNVNAFLLYKSYILFLFVIIVYVKTLNDIKRSQGGFISFGEGFIAIMVASGIGFLMCTLFEYVQFNIIDPTLADQLKDLTLEKMEEAAGMLGDDMLDDMTDAIHDQDFGFTMGRSAMSYLIRMVFPAAVVGAIISAILKKEKPLVL